ncbi:hypothetical protein [Collimonas fungivorans]|uniref:hypothetical protein n=1 Tax=Collimonas fungivorans TaxID=158899 RepID=UPI0026ED7C8C|nr:hypothetical protein [Collimonas fungivorans]
MKVSVDIKPLMVTRVACSRRAGVGPGLFLLIRGTFLMYHADPFELWRRLAIRGEVLPPTPGFIKPSAMRAFLFFQ